MKSTNFKMLILAALFALSAGNALASGSNTSKCHFEPGSAQFTAESGCTLEVKSGATLQIDSGATATNSGTAKINGNTLTATAGTATITIPNTTDTLVNLTGSQTLTNKTLTAPIISTISNTGTITLPTASVTLASVTGTETLTNKTLTSPVITGPAPVACTGTCTLGTANLGTFTKLDTAGGSVATLPAATGTGNVYRLVVTVANSSNADKVLTNPTSDVIVGTAIGENAGTAKIFVGNAGTFHSLQMPFAGTQPSGGFVGDTVTCTDIASATWLCNMTYQAGTTPTTPYSASTS